MAQHIADRLQAEGPKRMLALDGGGTRGIVTIAFLERIEAMLQAELGRGDDFTLAEYFDLIGGTSVGSILATLLALGWRMKDVREKFRKSAEKIFVPRSFGWIDAMFDARVLRGVFNRDIGDLTLGSDRLKTGLMVVAKRVDTGSVWVFINNPSHPYFATGPQKGNEPQRLGNGDYKLLDIIRASTAAPRYFSNKRMSIFKGPSDGIAPGFFVDGGVSPHNNPALQLLMTAGIRSYCTNGRDPETGKGRAWPLGADKLLLVSVGTGSYRHMVTPKGFAASDAVDVLQGMITDGQDLALTLLQWMSRPRFGWHVNRVLKDMADELIDDGAAGGPRPLLSFQRYDIRLESDWLADVANGIGKSVTRAQLDAMRDFTSLGQTDRLYEFARLAAQHQVSAADFPAVFRVGGAGA